MTLLSFGAGDIRYMTEKKNLKNKHMSTSEETARKRKHLFTTNGRSIDMMSANRTAQLELSKRFSPLRSDWLPSKHVTVLSRHLPDWTLSNRDEQEFKERRNVSLWMTLPGALLNLLGWSCREDYFSTRRVFSGRGLSWLPSISYPFLV